MSAGPEDIFARLGGDLVDPDAVLPAALPLELSGESVRGRLCIFTDNQNRDMAMRPDLTLPLAIEEVEARSKAQVKGARTVRYAARAFRLPAVDKDPMEFTQIGCERYGYDRSAEADATLFATVAEAAMSAGVRQGDVRFGDLRVFDTFVEALGLSPAVSQALRRAFREDGGVDALFEGAALPRNKIAGRLKGLPREEAARLVEDLIELSDTDLVGARSLDEVVTRLMEQAEEGGVETVPEDVRAVLRKLVAVSEPAERAVAALESLMTASGVSGLDALLSDVQARFETIQTLAPAFMEQAVFSVSFGRRFNYYDGFVFELCQRGGDPMRPFGAGGRYDKLLARLSLGTIDETAIGGVVRPDRLLQAREAQP